MEHKLIQKPKILLLADRPAWVFDNVAKSFVKFLSNDFEFKINYVVEEPDLNEWDFDLLYIFFWGETYHKKFKIDPKKVIKEVSSYRWMNEEKYGLLSPKEMAENYLSDAGNITSTSKAIIRLLSPYREIQWMPNGFDTDIFRNKKNRSGHLKIGWAGNINDPCKGVNDIVLPAISDDFVFSCAHNLLYNQMPNFYNDIDVFVIASTAEGQPITLIESMACGCFPVCVDVGIVPEIITHKRDGLIINRKIEAFRAAFQWCDFNKEYIRSIGNRNSVEIIETRSWKVLVNQCRDILYKSYEKSRE